MSRVPLRGGALAAAAAAAVCLLGGSLAPTAIAAPWLAPTDLSAPNRDAAGPGVAVDAAGDVTAVWSRYDGSNTVVQSSDRPAGGAWAPVADLSTAGRDAGESQVAVDSAGDVTAVWTRFDGSNTVIQSSSRPAGGAWGAPVDLSKPGFDATGPRIAVDANGNAVAVWRRFDGFDQIAQAALRLPSGAWLPPVDISAAGENAESPEVTPAPGGGAIAVWSRFDGTDVVVQVSDMSGDGAWSPALDLSGAGGDAVEPQVAADLSGNATAIWSRQDGSGTVVQASSRVGSGGWSAPVDVSGKGADAIEPQVAAGLGMAISVWSRSSGGPYTVVQSATRPLAGAWTPPIDISAAGTSTAEAPRVSTDPSGRAVAIWARSAGAPFVVESASRSPAGDWTQPAGLSVVGGSATQPALALDATGDGAAVWARSNGANAIVQAAGYDVTAPQFRSVSIPSVGTVKQPVSFSVGAFDVWSAIGSIGWAFGDGTGAAGAAASHAFARPGTYSVTLTVPDLLGNQSSVTRTIAIFNKASAARIVRLKSRRALLNLHCPSPAGCEGRVKLVARVEIERGGRTAGRRLAIAKGGFKIAGPATTAVPLRLGAIGRALVRKAGRKGLKAQLTGPGVKHRVVLILAP